MVHMQSENKNCSFSGKPSYSVSAPPTQPSASSAMASSEVSLALPLLSQDAAATSIEASSGAQCVASDPPPQGNCCSACFWLAFRLLFLDLLAHGAGCPFQTTSPLIPLFYSSAFRRALLLSAISTCQKVSASKQQCCAELGYTSRRQQPGVCGRELCWS
eukprot:1159890-Pelagomonas_calceolata.AAC.8